MAIIYTYPVKTNPVDDDLVLISDSADKNNTKQVKISSMRGATVSGVADVNISAVTSTLSSGAPLVSLPNSGNVIITSRAYAGAANVGHVPTGGSATTFLRGDGSWNIQSTMGSGNSYATGLVLAGNATHGNNFLRKDGTWASPPSVTPGTPLNSIQFNSASSFGGNDELTYDGLGGLTVGAVGGNKGIVTLQPEDGNDSGVLKIGHLNNTKYLSLGLGNNTMAASYSIDFPVAAPGGNNKILQSNSSGVLSWIDTPAAGAVTSYTNGSSNRVLTSNGTSGINGESSLLYNGSILTLGTNSTLEGSRNNSDNVQTTNGIIELSNTSTSAYAYQANLDSNSKTTGANRHIIFRYDGSEIGYIRNLNNNTVIFSGQVSDERKKKNIVDWNDKILDSFSLIEPKKFNYLNENDSDELTKGFIAQQMADKFPEAYPKDPDTENETGYYSFNASGMTVYLMKAIKELKEEIDTLKSRISTLEG